MSPTGTKRMSPTGTKRTYKPIRWMSAFGGKLDLMASQRPVREVQYWVPNICSSLQSRLNRLLPKSTNEIEKERQNYDGGRTDETSIADCKSCSCARVHRACFRVCSTSTSSGVLQQADTNHCWIGGWWSNRCHRAADCSDAI